MTPPIQDRGWGPQIVGTSIAVFDLVPRFLDGSVTETSLCQTDGLTPEQMAATHAYVFHNLESTPADHLRIEQRLAGGPRHHLGPDNQFVAHHLDGHASAGLLVVLLVDHAHAPPRR